LEIAAEAGVSPSTVDRVLNERGSVSPATRARVIAAARRLDVPRRLPDAHHGLIHVDILLPKNDAPFFQRLKLALQRSLQMLDRRIVVHRAILPEDDDNAITRAILRPRYKRSGLIVTTHDTARVRQALRTVIADGQPVVTMVTDVGDVPRLYYAGIDNYHAGRTAGYFLGRLARRKGRVLLLSGRMDYAAHIDRIGGCREVVATSFPELRCDSASIEIHDDPDLCYQAVSHALRRGPDVVGIYNSGAGSPGIEAALRRFGAAGKVVWVGHEISDEHRLYIEQHAMDLAIDQDPDGQVISALQHLLHACGVVEEAPPSGPNEFRLYCAENVRHSAYLPAR
jgi:LacI family transcriptional regulator